MTLLSGGWRPERVGSSYGANCTTFAQCHWPLGECMGPPDGLDRFGPKCWCLPGVYTIFSAGSDCHWADSAGAIAGQVVLCLVYLVLLALTVVKIYLIHRNISRRLFELSKVILAVWMFFFMFQSLLAICMTLRVSGPTLNVLVQIVEVTGYFSMLAPMLHTCWFFLFTVQMLHSLPAASRQWIKFLLYSFVSVCTLGLLAVSAAKAFLGGEVLHSAIDGVCGLATCFIAALLLGGPIWTFFRYYEAPPLLVVELKSVWILHFVAGLVTLVLMSDFIFMSVWRGRGYFRQNIFDEYNETRTILDFNYFFFGSWLIAMWAISFFSYNHSKRGHRSIALSDFSDNFDENRSHIYEAIHKDTTVYDTDSDFD